MAEWPRARFEAEPAALFWFCGSSEAMALRGVETERGTRRQLGKQRSGGGVHSQS